MMLEITTTPTLTVDIYDDDGLPRTGLVAATFPPVNWRPDGVGAAATITPVDLASLAAAWTAGGVFEIGDGKYRLDAPAALAASRRNVRLWGEETDKRLICPVLEVGNWANIDIIGTVGATVPTLAPTEGEIEIIVGDAYQVENDNEIPFSFDGWPDIAGMEVWLGIGPIDGDYLIHVQGTILAWGGATQSIYFELSETDTALLDPDNPCGAYGYSAQVNYTAGERTVSRGEVHAKRKWD